MKKIMLRTFILLITLNITLFGNPVPETVEISLDSFSIFGMALMVILSSLVGAFFLKDELP